MGAINRMARAITDTLEEEVEEVRELCLPLVPLAKAGFQLPATPPPSFLNIHLICEAASKLLFLTIHWSKALPVFGSLKKTSQVRLLRASWSDLFVLGLAQTRDQLHLDSILTAIAAQFQEVATLDRLALPRVRQITQTVCKIKEYVTALDRLKLDQQVTDSSTPLHFFAPFLQNWFSSLKCFFPFSSPPPSPRSLASCGPSPCLARTPSLTAVGTSSRSPMPQCLN